MGACVISPDRPGRPKDSPAPDAMDHEMVLRRAGAHTANVLAEIVDPGQRFAFPGKG